MTYSSEWVLPPFGIYFDVLTTVCRKVYLLEGRSRIDITIEVAIAYMVSLQRSFPKRDVIAFF